MASKLLQHFVPQFYFRLFNGGCRNINLITKSGQVIFDASVRKQCARNRFYGNAEVEEALSQIEARHAATLRTVLGIARGEVESDLSDEDFITLLGSLLFQRARVPRFSQTMFETTLPFLLEAFDKFADELPEDLRAPAKLARARGQVTFTQDRLSDTLFAIDLALRSAIALSDLHVMTVQNMTDYPFVFGDSPCVFYNRRWLHARSRGVLGYQSKGLMVFLPLDPEYHLLLYDPASYTAKSGSDTVALTSRGVVSQINALQVCSALENVYFASHSDAEYAQQLWHAHRRGMGARYGHSLTHKPGAILIDGKPTESEAIQGFETQLPITVDLPFLDVIPIVDGETGLGPRSPEIRDELDQEIDEVIDGPSDSNR